MAQVNSLRLFINSKDEVFTSSLLSFFNTDIINTASQL